MTFSVVQSRTVLTIMVPKRVWSRYGVGSTLNLDAVEDSLHWVDAQERFPNQLSL